MTIDDLKLLSKGNDEYCKFNAKIVNDLSGVEFIGVRTPDLRKIAKELTITNWQEYLENNNWNIHETKQIAFLIPTYLKSLNINEFFDLIDKLVPHASSWANTDALNLKLKYNNEEMWKIITKYLNDENPWAVRIGLNFMFANFVNDMYIKKVLLEIQKIDSRYRDKVAKGSVNYYVKMMIAWTLAEAAIKFRNQVENLLPLIDLQTAKYTKQKIRDSFRIK